MLMYLLIGLVVLVCVYMLTQPRQEKGPQMYRVQHKDRRVYNMPTQDYRRAGEIHYGGKDAWSGHSDTDKYYPRMGG